MIPYFIRIDRIIPNYILLISVHNTYRNKPESKVEGYKLPWISEDRTKLRYPKMQTFFKYKLTIFMKKRHISIRMSKCLKVVQNYHRRHHNLKGYIIRELWHLWTKYQSEDVCIIGLKKLTKKPKRSDL